MVYSWLGLYEKGLVYSTVGMRKVLYIMAGIIRKAWCIVGLLQGSFFVYYGWDQQGSAYSRVCTRKVW